MRPLIDKSTDLLITAASVGTKKGQLAFTDGVNDVVRQTIRRKQWATAFWPCGTDPVYRLQITARGRYNENGNAATHVPMILSEIA
jgi:hypothetical protein